jgi:hypothetical protein
MLSREMFKRITSYIVGCLKGSEKCNGIPVRRHLHEKSQQAEGYIVLSQSIPHASKHHAKMRQLCASPGTNRGGKKGQTKRAT